MTKIETLPTPCFILYIDVSLVKKWQMQLGTVLLTLLASAGQSVIQTRLEQLLEIDQNHNFQFAKGAIFVKVSMCVKISF